MVVHGRVNLYTTCVASTPPKLPLREEIPSLGIETVLQSFDSSSSSDGDYDRDEESRKRRALPTSNRALSYQEYNALMSGLGARDYFEREHMSIGTITTAPSMMNLVKNEGGYRSIYPRRYIESQHSGVFDKRVEIEGIQIANSKSCSTLPTRGKRGEEPIHMANRRSREFGFSSYDDDDRATIQKANSRLRSTFQSYDPQEKYVEENYGEESRDPADEEGEPDGDCTTAVLNMFCDNGLMDVLFATRENSIDACHEQRKRARLMGICGEGGKEAEQGKDDANKHKANQEKGGLEKHYDLARESKRKWNTAQRNPLFKACASASTTSVVMKNSLEKYPEFISLPVGDGKLPLHAVCLRSLPTEKSLLDWDESGSDNDMHVNNALLVHEMNDALACLSELLAIVTNAHPEAARVPDNAGDLPVHLLARHLWPIKVQWVDEINASEEATASLLMLITDCVETVLHPLREIRPLCRAPGSVGTLLPLHIGLIYGTSFDTIRQLLEGYREGAGIPCDSALPGVNGVYPLDILEASRPSIWETNAFINDEQVEYELSCFNQCSDLIFICHPNILPYRKETKRLQRIEEKIRDEAQFEENELRPSSRSIWIWMCTYENAKNADDHYAENVRRILDGLDSKSINKLSGVRNDDDEQLCDVATPMCAAILKSYLIFPEKTIVEIPAVRSISDTCGSSGASCRPLHGDASSSQMSADDLCADDSKPSTVALGAICREAFGITERMVPTSFIILPYKLKPSADGSMTLERQSDSKLAVIFAFQLSRINSADAIVGDINARAKKKEVGIGTIDDVEEETVSLLGTYRAGIGYLYLLDEYSGIPAVSPDDNIYPIEVDMTRSYGMALLPLMQMGILLMRGQSNMRALTQILCEGYFPSCSLPRADSARVLLSQLQYSNPDDSHEIQKDLDILIASSTVTSASSSSSAERHRPTWDNEIKHLKLLYKHFDLNSTFSGLRRIETSEGRFLWTTSTNDDDFNGINGDFDTWSMSPTGQANSDLGSQYGNNIEVDVITSDGTFSSVYGASSTGSQSLRSNDCASLSSNCIASNEQHHLSSEEDLEKEHPSTLLRQLSASSSDSNFVWSDVSDDFVEQSQLVEPEEYGEPSSGKSSSDDDMEFPPRNRLSTPVVSKSLDRDLQEWLGLEHQRDATGEVARSPENVSKANREESSSSIIESSKDDEKNDVNLHENNPLDLPEALTPTVEISDSSEIPSESTANAHIVQYCDRRKAEEEEALSQKGGTSGKDVFEDVSTQKSAENSICMGGDAFVSGSPLLHIQQANAICGTDGHGTKEPQINPNIESDVTGFVGPLRGGENGGSSGKAAGNSVEPDSVAGMGQLSEQLLVSESNDTVGKASDTGETNTLEASVVCNSALPVDGVAVDESMPGLEWRVPIRERNQQDIMESWSEEDASATDELLGLRVLDEMESLASESESSIAFSGDGERRSEELQTAQAVSARHESSSTSGADASDEKRDESLQPSRNIIGDTHRTGTGEETAMEPMKSEVFTETWPPQQGHMLSRPKTAPLQSNVAIRNRPEEGKKRLPTIEEQIYDNEVSSDDESVESGSSMALERIVMPDDILLGSETRGGNDAKRQQALDKSISSEKAEKAEKAEKTEKAEKADEADDLLGLQVLENMESSIGQSASCEGSCEELSRCIEGRSGLSPKGTDRAEIRGFGWNGEEEHHSALSSQERDRCVQQNDSGLATVENREVDGLFGLSVWDEMETLLLKSGDQSTAEHLFASPNETQCEIPASSIGIDLVSSSVEIGSDITSQANISNISLSLQATRDTIREERKKLQHAKEAMEELGEKKEESGLEANGDNSECSDMLIARSTENDSMPSADSVPSAVGDLAKVEQKAGLQLRIAVTEAVMEQPYFLPEAKLGEAAAVQGGEEEREEGDSKPQNRGIVPRTANDGSIALKREDGREASDLASITCDTTNDAPTFEIDSKVQAGLSQRKSDIKASILAVEGEEQKLELDLLRTSAEKTEQPRYQTGNVPPQMEEGNETASNRASELHLSGQDLYRREELGKRRKALQAEIDAVEEEERTLQQERDALRAETERRLQDEHMLDVISPAGEDHVLPSISETDLISQKDTKIAQLKADIEASEREERELLKERDELRAFIETGLRDLQDDKLKSLKSHEIIKQCPWSEGRDILWADEGELGELKAALTLCADEVDRLEREKLSNDGALANLMERIYQLESELESKEEEICRLRISLRNKERECREINEF